MGDGDLMARREQALGAGAPLFYQQPIEIVRGDGVYLFDADGRRYIDLYNNVPCVGHGNPVVAEAMARQQRRLNVHSRYLHDGIVSFAERLSGLHGGGVESVVFTCSGTEANEVALRAARLFTGRRGIVCSDATYHGNSELVGSLTHVGRANPETDTVRAFPFPECYRPLVENLEGEALTAVYLERLGEAISRLEASGAGLAALIVCSLLANEGLPDIPPGFMARAAEMARAAGGLVIADEVQAGYGRSGRWWGYQTSDFVPDIVVMGKPMGNGLPLAAMAASRPIVEAFRSRTRYFNTFAASPLQAAVGMAVLDEIEQRRLVEHAAELGAWLKSELEQRIDAHPGIGDVRGHGLFVGVEMVVPDGGKSPDSALAARIADELKRRGYLTGNAGAFGNVLKIRPPLVIGRDHLEEFLAAFDETLAQAL